MKLLLFDIDGTLIRSDGAGRLAMSAALIEIFGTDGPLADYSMSGKTDARIVLDLMLASGFSEQAIVDKLPELYDRLAAHALEIYPKRQMSHCEGVVLLLEALRIRDNVVVGLLTGNARQTAGMKLSAAGIDPEQFSVGAYGSDHIDRNHLPAIAMDRAQTLTGRTFTGDNSVIIGDTPADILCARAGKARAVAVASGWYAADTLAQYRPDHLFVDMTDTSSVMRALMDD